MHDLATTAVRIGGHAWQIRHPRDAEALIDEADFARDERLPYWADLWPSAHVLADLLVRHHGNGRRALELGCGSGLVACALAAAGYHVTASDYYEAALEVTQENVWRNTGVSIETRLADWRALPADLGQFALVVASDVLYERAYAEQVADALQATVAPDGCAIVADPGRVAFDTFLTACSSRRFVVDERWEVPREHDRQRHLIRVVVLRAANARP